MIDAFFKPSATEMPRRNVQAGTDRGSPLMVTISTFFTGLSLAASKRRQQWSRTATRLIANRKPPPPSKPFKITHELLSQTLCAGLAIELSTQMEYQRRASQIAFLLRAAGAEVDMGEFEVGEDF